jgi:hypothetical protein
MPYSDGLNYVMKWKTLEGRSRTKTTKAKRVQVEGEQKVAEGKAEEQPVPVEAQQSVNAQS